MSRIDPVREGVYFTTPPALPRGRHVLDRGEVVTAQRERLMIAATEIMASDGYRAVGVREIAARARVSRAAFYECFADKDECVVAAYDRFIGVLIDRVVGALQTTTHWSSTVEVVIGAYLETLQSDLVVARAFQVEMDGLGRRARDQRRTALTGMARMLKEQRDLLWPGAEHVPLNAYVAAVYAIRQMASDELDVSDAPHLPAMGRAMVPRMNRMLDRAPAEPGTGVVPNIPADDGALIAPAAAPSS
jgi:AcrR family transcriptional regulator